MELFLAKEFYETLFFGWVFGIFTFIYLLLPRKACYALMRVEARFDEWKDDVSSLGTRRHRITVNYTRSFVISKIAAFILFIYCAVLIYNSFK